jgi:hypothetical protein
VVFPHEETLTFTLAALQRPWEGEIAIMPQLSRDELWSRVRGLDGQRIPSLTGRSSHRIALIDGAERQYEVQYDSGNTAIVSLDELYALYRELYAHGSLTNSYMDDNVQRILGWDSWNRPGSAMFAILPLLDDAIEAVGGSLKIDAPVGGPSG